MSDIDRPKPAGSLDEDGLDGLFGVLRESTEVQPPAGLAARLRVATVLSPSPWPGRLALGSTALIAWLLLSLAAPLAVGAIAALTAFWWLAPAAGLVFVATQAIRDDGR